MKPYELPTALKQKGIGPLYLIAGDEDYMRDQAVAMIKAAVRGRTGEGREAAPDAEGGELDVFNESVLYADECDAAEILSQAGEAPVFAAHRLVLVKAAEKLPVRDGEALISYLRAPCESTTLVFVAGKKLDERRKFTQALYKAAMVVDCASLSEQQLPEWIKREAVLAGVRVNDEAVLLLREFAVSLKEAAGGSLYMTRRELEKLAAYVPEGQVAGAAEVAALRGVEPGASVFDLAAAIGARDRGRTLRILARNLEAGEDPLRILGALVWQYRRIWKAKEQPRQWGREADMSRFFPEPRLKAAFRMFPETDSKLKGAAGGSKARVLESLLLALCESPEARGPAAGPAKSIRA
jgi:DNA polymerase-3 subunit delta